MIIGIVVIHASIVHKIENRNVHFFIFTAEDGTRDYKVTGVQTCALPIFTPTVLSRKEGPLASFRSSGGTNWPGGAYDPETQVLYVPSYTSLVPVSLMPSPGPEFSDIRYVLGNAVSGVRYITGPGENAGADAPPPARGTNPHG